MALAAIEEKCNEIREMFRDRTEDGRDIGWTNKENFGDFAQAELTDDREFLRKLVNLGLSLP